MSIRRRPLALAAASLLTLSFALTGCAVPIPGIGNVQLPVEGIKNAIQDATGLDVNVGASSTVPADWPGLPLPDGTLISSVVAGGVFSLSYELKDAAPIDSLRAALLAEGFEVTAETSGDLGAWVAAGPGWTVSLGWYSDNGLVYLNYSAVPTS